MSDIARTPVASSNIVSAGYHEPSSRLHVEFANGGVYEYAGVPPDVAEGLRTASSAGAYHHAHIKSGGYECRKLDG